MSFFNEYQRLEKRLRAIELLDKSLMNDVEQQANYIEYDRIWNRIGRLNEQMH